MDNHEYVKMHLNDNLLCKFMNSGFSAQSS